KVSINSGAVRNPDFVQEASQRFGSQCIVVAIDAKQRPDCSGWDVFVRGGRENTGLDAVKWAQDVVARGAGELLITSMDADGTKAGYDLDLTRTIATSVNVPVIASGGAGNCDHIYDALTNGHAEAALLASLLHYGELTVAEIKSYLHQKQIAVRP
ncbi:MAG: HisA/HisF-related TIM barrel protein, partial [Cyanobacteria bacterium P01_F01_bin.116]